MIYTNRQSGVIILSKISVILATYNGEKYLYKAIDSILNQTYSDFELIIVDDGSSDSTQRIIDDIKDNRIVYLRNKQNRGLPYSLNRGMKYARGEYIARMDDDDISLPTRLEEQLRYMEGHKDVAICGCLWKAFGKSSYIDVLPEDEEGLRVNTLFGSPLAHSSWFMRSSIVKEDGMIYNTSYNTSQDYDFLYRAQKKYKIACVQKLLLFYRVHGKSITGQMSTIDKNTLRVQRRILRSLDIVASEKELSLLNRGSSMNGIVEYIMLMRLFHKIMKKNKKRNIYNQVKLEKELKRRLVMVGK